MRRLLLMVPLALALTAPAAHAGGFATAGLSSTPDGVGAGQPWTVDVTILQHGRTPAEGLQPRIVIRSRDAVRQFDATPAGEPGVYRAEVVFPAAGTWRYEVLDGFNDAMPHRFPAVRIADRGPAPAAVTDRPAEPGGMATGWLWAAAAALVLAATVIVVDRRRRRPGLPTGAPEPA